MTRSKKMLLQATAALFVSTGGLLLATPSEASAAARACPENFCVSSCDELFNCGSQCGPFECIPFSNSCGPGYGGLATCARES
jgi:hypothetical protein